MAAPRTKRRAASRVRMPARPTRADSRRRYFNRFASIRADLAKRAKMVVPAVARTKADRALQARWWKNPGRYDMEGIDTPGSAPSASISSQSRRRRVKTSSRPPQAAASRITSAPSIADPRRSYKFRWRVVDLDDLVTSHTDTFEPNPRFPSELQPRLRDRAGARLKVGKIAKTLSPDALLLDTHQIDQGPMIVAPDLVVESGNGRTMALRMAHQEFPKRWKEYERELRGRLEEYGLKSTDLEGIEAPVLVRERISDVDRIAFAREANQSAVLQLSPLELALQDARALSDRFIKALMVSEGQSLDQALTAPANRGLVRHFLEKAPENERAALIDGRGNLNIQGLQRLKAALFARVYGGEAGQRLTQTFFESIDPLVKNMEAGLFSSLPAMARSEGMVRSGERDKALSIAKDIASAVDMFARLKQQGLSVEYYMAQKSFVDDGLTSVQKSLLSYLPEIARSPKRIRELLDDYAEFVGSSPHPNQKTMGGLGGFKPPDKEETLDRLMRKQRDEIANGRSKRGQISIFAGTPLKSAAAGAGGAKLGIANVGGRMPTQRQLDRAVKA